jgi:hypothetical protein
MSLRTELRGFRAIIAMLVCVCVAVTPAAAAAAKKPQHTKKPTAVRKEAQSKKPAAGRVKYVGTGTGPAVPDNGLGNRRGLPVSTQIAAMTTAINAAPAYFAGRETGCPGVTPMVASVSGDVMAGNFRGADGYCYVWLNLGQSDTLTGSEICKVALHEIGHLTGLTHSADPRDLMYSPFASDPIPAPCQAPAAAARRL